MRRGRGCANAVMRRSRASVLVATTGVLLGLVSPAAADTTRGPAVPMKASDWTDCGNGLGGVERLSTLPASATAGVALHEHRYCPTRPATVSYVFYAYDAADRNICTLAETTCDPSVPHDAFAVVTATWRPGDFTLGGDCYPRGCPLRAELPAGTTTEVKNVVAEAIDDAGAYGLVHNVSWRAPLVPADAPPSAPPPLPAATA